MSYAAAVLADSPVRYYRLDETTGTTMVDATGAQNGTYVGPTLGVASANTPNLGTAVRFDGVDDRATVANNAALSGFGDFTIEFWLRAVGDWAGYAVNVYSVTGNQRSWGFFMSSSPAALAINLSQNGTSFTGYTSFFPRADLDDGAWHHLVFTRSGSAGISYIDGTQEHSGSVISGTLHASTSILALGMRSDVTAFANIELDEVAIYNTALSGARIAAHYAAAFAAAPPTFNPAWIQPTRVIGGGLS